MHWGKKKKFIFSSPKVHWESRQSAEATVCQLVTVTLTRCLLALSFGHQASSLWQRKRTPKLLDEQLNSSLQMCFAHPGSVIFTLTVQWWNQWNCYHNKHPSSERGGRMETLSLPWVWEMFIISPFPYSLKNSLLHCSLWLRRHCLATFEWLLRSMTSLEVAQLFFLSFPR